MEIDKDALTDFLLHQRWFGSKSQDIAEVRVLVEEAEVAGGDGGWHVSHSARPSRAGTSRSRAARA